MLNKTNEHTLVLIVTHSRKGFTDSMAEAIAKGVGEVPSTKAVLMRVTEVQVSDFDWANAVAVGCPTYLHYMSGELKHFLDNTYYTLRKTKKGEKLSGKPAVAFTSGVNKGYYLRKLQFRSIALKELERILFSTLKMRKVAQGIHLFHAKPFPLTYQSTDRREPLSLTSVQIMACMKLGKKLALSTCPLSDTS